MISILLTIALHWVCDKTCISTALGLEKESNFVEGSDWDSV